MRPVYKKVKIFMPHCPLCGQQLSGDNSIAFPWSCACGVWEAVLYPFNGEYQINNVKEKL